METRAYTLPSGKVIEFRLPTMVDLGLISPSEPVQLMRRCVRSLDGEPLAADAALSLRARDAHVAQALFGRLLHPDPDGMDLSRLTTEPDEAHHTWVTAPSAFDLDAKPADDETGPPIVAGGIRVLIEEPMMDAVLASYAQHDVDGLKAPRGESVQRYLERAHWRARLHLLKTHVRAYEVYDGETWKRHPLDFATIRTQGWPLSVPDTIAIQTVFGDITTASESDVEAAGKTEAATAG